MIKEFIKGFKQGQKLFGDLIGFIINSVLLTIVYIFGVGLTFFVSRIFNKHFLDKEFNNGSYWSELNLTKKPLEEYYRQF